MLLIGKLSLDISPIKITANLLLPFSLIINKIFSNIYKHTFKNSDLKTPKVISIKLTKKNDKSIELIITDNGMGFTQSTKEDLNKTTGIGLMKMFTRQLHGSLSFENANGTLITIIIPGHNH